jgi:uncharacterized membrane protein (DUF106 family)
MGENGNRVYLTDKMVLFGIGIGAAYWIIECLLYVFLSYQTNLTDRLFGPTFNDLSTRLVVLCLFLIFGAHAQYAINKRKQIEKEMSELKKTVEKLKRDLEAKEDQGAKN